MGVHSVRSRGPVPRESGEDATPQGVRANPQGTSHVSSHAAIDRAADDSRTAGGVSTFDILALQRSAGNQAVAAVMQGASYDLTVQRGPTDTDFDEAVYGGAIVGMHNVPAGLKGRELKVYVVARWGRLSREEAAALVDRTGVPSGGVDRRRDGYGQTRRAESASDEVRGRSHDIIFGACLAKLPTGLEGANLCSSASRPSRPSRRLVGPGPIGQRSHIHVHLVADPRLSASRCPVGRWAPPVNMTRSRR